MNAILLRKGIARRYPLLEFRAIKHAVVKDRGHPVVFQNYQPIFQGLNP